jgi:hypothetical protein
MGHNCLYCGRSFSAVYEFDGFSEADGTPVETREVSDDAD